MSTIVSHSKRFVFFHIYKTAGTSITNVLQRYENAPQLRRVLRTVNMYVPLFVGTTFDHHASPAQFESIKKIRGYYKFAFVRNPWDWQVSLYSFMKNNVKHPQHRMIRNMNFEEYISWRARPGNYRLQSSLLADSDGIIRLDFIGRFEHLAEDFSLICERVGIAGDLPRKKSSPRGDYTEYYTARTRDIVATVFAADIVAFGYEF